LLRRPIFNVLLLLFMICVCMPVLIVRGCTFYDTARTGPIQQGGPQVILRRAATGALEHIALEEYIKGVVAAEMPALFHLEALKAQAVLARTYVVRRMRIFGGPGDPDHPTADISDDPARGQAWLDQNALKERWGLLHFAGYWSKISRAVEETAGLIACYDGELIEGAYHSTCGGRTEDSGAVWQVSLPYLQPVACQWDSHSPHQERLVTLTWQQMEAKLGAQAGALAVAASGGGGGVISVLSRTVGDRVAQIRIGDLSTTGVAARRALELPSARFWVTETSSKGLTLTVKGYGHGVGMCQYGADGMANQGKRYAEIIAYYFSGVTLRPIFHE
jgi:stage II sporulation protein D